MEPLTLTLTEAAESLGVSVDWLQRAAAKGTVPSRKVGSRRRFTRQDLDDYLESVRHGGAPSLAGTARSQQRRRTA